MKKIGITSAKVHVEMDYWLRGSVLRGDVVSGWNEVRTHFEVESDENEEAVLEVIRLAKAGCYAERLVETAVPLHSTAILNGKSVELPSEGK